MLIAFVVRLPAPFDQAARIHRVEGRVGGRLHHPGLVAELALRQAIVFPQDAQEDPVTERHVVLCQTLLQRAIEHARRILDQVGEAVVRHRFAPMTQDGSRVVGADFAGAAHAVPALRTGTWWLNFTSRPLRAESSMARQTSIVAIDHAPSCKGGMRLTTAA